MIKSSSLDSLRCHTNKPAIVTNKSLKDYVIDFEDLNVNNKAFHLVLFPLQEKFNSCLYVAIHGSYINQPTCFLIPHQRFFKIFDSFKDSGINSYGKFLLNYFLNNFIFNNEVHEDKISAFKHLYWFNNPKITNEVKNLIFGKTLGFNSEYADCLNILANLFEYNFDCIDKLILMNHIIDNKCDLSMLLDLKNIDKYQINQNKIEEINNYFL